LGFERDEDFSVLRAEALDFLAAESLPKVGTKQIQAIAEFDSRWFGGDRRKLLESLILEEGNLSYYKSESDEVVGFVVAKVYGKMAEVGPLVCRTGHVDDAVMLLKAVLGKLTDLSVNVFLPKKETALADMLFNIGFKEDFSVSRMFLGRPVAKNCICMAESLERG
jgi:hypothetical protein